MSRNLALSSQCLPLRLSWHVLFSKDFSPLRSENILLPHFSRKRNSQPSMFCHGWGIWSVLPLNGELWNKFEKFERHLGNHYVLTETFSKMITASIQLDFTDQWRISHVMFVLTSHFGQQENFTLWGSRSLDEKIPLLITIFTCLLYFHFYD